MYVLIICVNICVCVCINHIIIYCYLLGKGGYVFGSVGLCVCLSVDITHKDMNGLG